jgi:hypothetical protein
MRTNGREEVGNMAKFIARVFVPMYIELEAENEEDAQNVAKQWYKEQKKDWKEPTVEVMPIR